MDYDEQILPVSRGSVLVEPHADQLLCAVLLTLGAEPSDADDAAIGAAPLLEIELGAIVCHAWQPTVQVRAAQEH